MNNNNNKPGAGKTPPQTTSGEHKIVAASPQSLGISERDIAVNYMLRRSAEARAEAKLRGEKSSVKTIEATKTTDDAAWLRRAAVHRNGAYALAAVQNPNTPDELLGLILFRNLNGIQLYDAFTKRATPLSRPIKMAMLGHLNEYVRRFIAASDQIDDVISNALASDDNFGVRSAIARNPLCPLAALEKLARSEDHRSRCDAASSDNVSAEILEMLSVDGMAHVRRSVARNILTPFHVLENLTLDDDNGVASDAFTALRNKRRSGVTA